MLRPQDKSVKVNVSCSLAIVALFFLAAATPSVETRQNAGYDPSRDPEQDLRFAIADARENGKRIILVIGGEWCVWCHILDRFLSENKDIQTVWSDNYVTVKVNVSPENGNEEFLSRYPKVEGYPYFFVLEKDGSLLHSQRTAKLESGYTYSKEKMREFLKEWAPKQE
jgi:thioredoxin-related protein